MSELSLSLTQGNSWAFKSSRGSQRSPFLVNGGKFSIKEIHLTRWRRIYQITAHQIIVPTQTGKQLSYAASWVTDSWGDDSEGLLVSALKDCCNSWFPVASPAIIETRQKTRQLSGYSTRICVWNDKDRRKWTQTHLATFNEQISPTSSGHKLKYAAQAVSFAAVFRDVTQRSPLWGSVAWHHERRLLRRLLLKLQTVKVYKNCCHFPSR